MLQAHAWHCRCLPQCTRSTVPTGRRLDYSLMVYVFECLRRNTTQVRNIRAYLLTTLFNAPLTMNNHYQAEVQHDFGL